MSGRGKGAKGLGMGGKSVFFYIILVDLLCCLTFVLGAKRHRKMVVLGNEVKALTKPAIRRLARRAGIKRISGSGTGAGSLTGELRNSLRKFLNTIIKDSLLYMHNARRKTIVAVDVLHSLKHNQKHLYV